MLNNAHELYRQIGQIGRLGEINLLLFASGLYPGRFKLIQFWDFSFFPFAVSPPFLQCSDTMQSCSKHQPQERVIRYRDGLTAKFCQEKTVETRVWVKSTLWCSPQGQGRIEFLKLNVEFLCSGQKCDKIQNMDYGTKHVSGVSIEWDSFARMRQSQ